MKKKRLISLIVGAAAFVCGCISGVSAITVSAANNGVIFNKVTENNKEVTYPDFSVAEGIDEVEYKLIAEAEGGEKASKSGAGLLGAFGNGGGLYAVSALALTVALAAFVIGSDKAKAKASKAMAIALAVCCVGGSFAGCNKPSEQTKKLSAAKNQTAYGYAGEHASKTVAPDERYGFTEAITATKILSTFEYGYECKYDNVSSLSPHYWAENEVEYSEEMTLSYEQTAISNTTELSPDNYAYWSVYGNGSANLYGETRYTLYMPNEVNYLDTRPFTVLRVKYMGLHSAEKDVTLTAVAQIKYEEADGNITTLEYELGKFSGGSHNLYEVYYPLSKIPAEHRANLARVIFRTTGENLAESEYQENRLYYVDLCVYGENASNPTMDSMLFLSSNNGGGVMEMSSEYLGSLGYHYYGAYSATGFYDTSDGKYKLWYGCGIPEASACDNVYYMETTDINLGWSQPKRLVLNDPTGKLSPHNAAPGYGGDPSVIKVDGTYYMYFSGLEDTNSPPNKIYLATSKNGVDFTVYGPVVDVIKEGLGYGAGAPSVTYKDGKYYLYYYTQSATNVYTDDLGNQTTQIEPTGFVLKVGDTPYTFGRAQKTRNTAGGADVKWVPSLNMWVAADYTDGDAYGGYDFDTIRIGYSKDGITFDFTNDPITRPIQDYSTWINHNAGWIGTETGFGYETMFLTYGVNDMDLHGYDNGKQMNSRQMAWTRVTLHAA